MRAFYAGLNKLAATGVFPEQSSVCASLNVAAPHSLTDEERNKSEMHLRECIRWASEAALTNKVTIISAEVNIVPAMQTYYATATFTARAGQDAIARIQGEKAGKDVVMTKWMGLEGTSLIASARQCNAGSQRRWSIWRTLAACQGKRRWTGHRLKANSCKTGNDRSVRVL